MIPRVSRAFTLIELLIVVAIIAILAAIAIPNFLEAQVRSKVSRVKTDHRSMAVAIESYSVDNNRVPIGFDEGIQRGLWFTTDRYKCYRFFTTPIAYMTSVPKDPFCDPEHGYVGAMGWMPFTEYTYLNMRWGNLTPGNAYVLLAASLGYEWTLRSNGPIRRAYAPWEYVIIGSQSADNVYDATNGTVSRGLIFRTNKGVYTGPGT